MNTGYIMVREGRAMNRRLTALGILLLAAIVVGVVRFNHPGTLIDPLSKLEKTDRLTVYPADVFENET
jgi:hypothetical protein